MTKSTLEQCRQADIMTCEQSNLVDLCTVRIDPNLPVEERTMQFLDQIRNPYLFRVEDLVVKVRFTGNRSFTSAIASLC